MVQPLDAVLSETDIQEIMAAIATIRAKLPFLIGLTTAERRSLVKLGSKSQTFVEKALDIATEHSGLMPRSLDEAEIKAAQRDIDLFEALHPILQNISQLRELIGDTQMIAGSEAYATARTAYKSAKLNGKNMGLDEVINDLSRQFQRTRKTTPQS